jgi:selenocysteine lyase/cysteine desulfurase
MYICMCTGGPGTPGVLIIKKKLLRSAVPSNPCGGTVFFVTSESQTYLENIEEREEGGTPDIIGAIRAGLVFHIKESIGVTKIHERENGLLMKAWNHWSKNKNILLLGHPPSSTPRLAIVSFLISHGSLYLHWNFIAALLNDLFGIQV